MFLFGEFPIPLLIKINFDKRTVDERKNTNKQNGCYKSKLR